MNLFRRRAEILRKANEARDALTEYKGQFTRILSNIHDSNATITRQLSETRSSLATTSKLLRSFATLHGIPDSHFDTAQIGPPPLPLFSFRPEAIQDPITNRNKLLTAYNMLVSLLAETDQALHDLDPRSVRNTIKEIDSLLYQFNYRFRGVPLAVIPPTLGALLVSPLFAIPVALLSFGIAIIKSRSHIKRLEDNLKVLSFGFVEPELETAARLPTSMHETAITTLQSIRRRMNGYTEFSNRLTHAALFVNSSSSEEELVG